MQSNQAKATVQSKSSLGAAFKELKDQIKRATAQYETISAIAIISIHAYDVEWRHCQVPACAYSWVEQRFGESWQHTNAKSLFGVT